MEKYWAMTKGNLAKTYTMESYWTRAKSYLTKRYMIKSCWSWTKIHLSYRTNKGVLYEPVLDLYNSLSNIHCPTDSLAWEAGTG